MCWDTYSLSLREKGHLMGKLLLTYSSDAVAQLPMEVGGSLSLEGFKELLDVVLRNMV